MTVDEALAAVRAGDHAAFRHAIGACEAEVRVLLAAMLPDRTRVDACVHEAFVTAYHRLDGFRAGREDGKAWIVSVARAVGMAARRAAIRVEQAKRPHRAEIEASLDDELMARVDRGLGKTMAGLPTCLAQLHEAAREVVVEHYWRGTVPADIAQLRERSNAWVRVTLFRAREALAACLEPGAGSGGDRGSHPRKDGAHGA